MRKLFFLIAVAAMTATATAQDKSTWGVRAGLNISNATLKSGGLIADLDSRVGYNVGISFQHPLVSNLFLETGLNLTTRGMRVDLSKFDDEMGAGTSNKAKFNMLYLQLPVAFSWHFDISKFSLQPFVGVYYSYGIHGKVKEESVDEKLNLFKDTDLSDGDTYPQLLKRSDFGLRFGVGAALKQFYVGVGYDLGIMNMIKDKQDLDQGKFKNGNLFITVGYNF